MPVIPPPTKANDYNAYESGEPAPTTEFNFMPDDGKFEKFKISAQSEQILKLIEDKDLLKVSGSTLTAVEHSLKKFEFDNQHTTISKMNTTAHLTGAVTQTVYETAMMQPDTSYKTLDEMTPTEREYEAKLQNETQEIIRAIYDDPIANPLKSELGGYYDFNQAQQDLADGKSAKNFNAGILPRNQEIVVEAMKSMPVYVQQLAAQGAKQASIDARHNKSLGGMKTATTFYVKGIISDNMYSFDQTDKSIGKYYAGGSHEEGFERGMYDAKGTQLFKENANNLELTSKQPHRGINVDLGDSFANMMRDGLNEQAKKLREDYQKPHTFIGDKGIGFDTNDLLSNATTFIDTIAEKLVDDSRDRNKDRDLVTGYLQARNIVNDTELLSHELAETDKHLDKSIYQAQNQIDAHGIDVGKILTEHYEYQQQQEATNDNITPDAPEPNSPMRP